MEVVPNIWEKKKLFTSLNISEKMQKGLVNYKTL